MLNKAKQSFCYHIGEHCTMRHPRKGCGTPFNSASGPIKLCMGGCCSSHQGIIYSPMTQRDKVKCQPISHVVSSDILKC